MKQLPTLLILCGLPGSGKSTYCQHSNSNFIRLSSDDYIEKVARDQGKTYNEVFSYAIRDADRDFKQKLDYYADTEYNIIIDRTNLTVKTRRKIINKFKNHQKMIVFFNVPLNTIKERNIRPGKIFSEEMLDDMYSRLEIPTELEAQVVTVS